MAEDKMIGYDYTAHAWEIGEPITQDKMTNLENAVETAFARMNGKVDSSDIEQLTSTANANKSDIANIKNVIIPGLDDRITQNLAEGSQAWAQIAAAATFEVEEGEDVVNLAQRLANMDSLIEMKANTNLVEPFRADLELVMNEVEGARGSHTSLADHFNDVQSQIASAVSSINSTRASLATFTDTSKGNYNSLAARLNAMDGGQNLNNYSYNDPSTNETVTITVADQNIPAMYKELRDTRTDATTAYLSLSARLAAMDTRINSVTGTAGTAIQANKIVNSLDSEDATAVLGGQTGGLIKNAVATAKQEAITAANTYADNKIPKTAIANNYDTDTAGYVLGAAQGKDLNTRLTTAEGTLSAALVSSAIRTNNQPTTFASVDARLENIEGLGLNVQNEIEDAHRTDLGLDEETGLPIQDTLRDRFEAIESAQVSNNTALDNRITALETEVDMTSVNSRIDNVETEVTSARTSSVITDTETTEEGGETITTQVPHTYASVDARLEAIESHAAAVRADINTIATELSMFDIADNITGATSRIDQLETNVVTMANEIGMLQNGAAVQDMATSITGNTTRIDSIETEIGNAHRANINNDTLDNRFDAIENNISHPVVEADPENNIEADAGGLTERLEVVEDSITGNGGINDRLDALDTAGTGTIALLQQADSDLDDRLDAIDGGTAFDITNGTLAARLSAAETLLGTTATTANSALQPADIATLTSDVNTLKGKDTVVISYDGEISNYTNNEPNLDNPSVNADYLIADDDGKYFYWRYFGAGENEGWQMVGGAGNSGGTGSSSGQFIASLSIFEEENAPIPDVNTDYFVGDNTIGYTHYRYLIPDGAEIGSFVRILPKGLLINASVNANGGLVAGTVENPNTNVFNTFVALKSVDSEVVTDTNGNASGTKLTFVDTNGTSYPITVQGGGGGGSTYTVKLSNETGALQLTVPDIEGTVTNLQARAIVKEGADIATNLGSALVVTTQYSASSNGPWTTLDSRTVNNNESFQVNVSNILRTGVKMYVRMTLTTTLDEQTFNRPINFEITKVEMSISAINFNQAMVRTGNLVFQYKCIGSDLTKIVHFKIDGVDAVTPITTDSHNEPLQQTIALTGKEVGMHSFEVYFTVGNVSSNILNYYILYNPNTANVSPMIALAAEKATITYGDELKINYTTAVNSNIETMDDVHLELYTVNNNVETVITETELTNVRNEEVHTWIPIDYPLQGTAYIRGVASRTVNGTVQTDTKTITITINELVTDYNLTPAGTDNLLYSYTAYGRTNHDVGKEQYTYTYTSHDTGNPELTWTGAFNNFNWSTDGYADGQSLTIGGGATHTIDLPIFETKKNNISLEVDPSAYNDPTQNGRTIEIEYEVQSATDLNDVIIDCMDNNHVGFRITPQSCYLLNNNVDISLANDGTGTILNEDAIAAAYLTTGVRTHLAFVIEPWAATKAYDNKYHQSVNIYLNGEFANACPYNRDNSTGNISDSFKTNATIRIGSASCIIKLYSIKMYNRGLTHTEILQNYKMAPGKTLDKIARFDKNNIIRGGKVDYELARKKFNCLLLVGPEPVIRQNEQGQDYNAMPTISPYKGSPSPIGRTKDGEVVGKTESGLILTYPDGSIEGYKTEFSLLDKMSDLGYASSNNVQGTSSQKYPIHNLKVYLMKGTAGKEVYDSEDILTREVNSNSITTAATAAYQSVYTEAEEIPAYITNCASTIATLVQNSDPMLTRAQVTQAVIDYLTNEDADVGAAYVSTNDELVVEHEFIGYSKSEKVKYKLPGSKGKGESTLCWKADYMSTDHANTYNANIADSLFSDSLNPNITNEDWQANVQNTVHGIRCLLFKQEGNNAPEFVADGCLNNDKGNSKTYGLEYTGDDGANTTAQKWEFTNNSDDLGFFKYDCVFYPTGNDQHYRALDAFESCFPDQGDLEDAQDNYKAEHDNQEDPNLNPNYNHLQVLLTWVSQRANYWDETDPTIRAQKKEIFRTEFTRHFNLDHVLVYYLFSEYTALCDNRVKNMFMRSDTIRNERIKLLNGTTIFEGNDNPNADYWKSFTDVQTTEVNQQAIINTIAAVYSEIHELEEVTVPDYAETVVAQVVADASESTLTLAQLQALIVSYLNAQEAAVGAGYMAVSTNNEYVVEHRMSHAADIDWEEGEEHSQFARWAPVLYDLDSCFGVENVGLLKIPYNADWQYFSEGQYRFNGHDSIFWLMVEDTFKSELAAKALALYNRSRGLNYNTFYQEQVVDNNNETAPAMTNQDMLLKFDAPWATGFMNYANTPPTYETPEYKYLQRGTRAAQKTSFLFKRSMLLSSRYQAQAFLNDKISFRYGADLTANQAVIECSANQILYPAVSFGDNKGWTQALELTNGTAVIDGLVNAGDTCRIRATSSAKGQDTLFIAGASVLTDIGDLSVFKPYELKVGQGKNLKRLIIGSNAAGYTNAVTSTIENLSACSILEEINIRNCTAFTTLDVSANGLIKRIYAAGSGAGTISLPSGGVLNTIEYSAITSNITILNHGSLQNFTFEIESGEEGPTYSSLNKLWIENTPNVPVVDIVTKRMGSLTNGLRLINIDVDLGNDPTFLQTIASNLADGKYLDSTGSLNIAKPPEITGRVHISEIRASLLAKVQAMYPKLVVYNVIDGSGNPSNNIISEYTVEYRNYDNTLLYTDNRTNTENYIDPVFDIDPITGEPYIPVPTKPADAQYKYRFGTYNSRTGNYVRYSGWVRQGTTTNPNSSMTVNGDTVFIAVYPTTEIQTYIVTWYDKYNGTAKHEVEVNYGTDLSSTLSPIELGTLARTDRSGNQIKVFEGWSCPLGKITSDVNVYALWQTSGINENVQDVDLSALNAADIYAISLLGNETKSSLLRDKLGDTIFIPMGQDFNYVEGVNVTNLLGANTELTFDGTQGDVRVYNSIKPLAENSDWTLAIDYKLLIDSQATYTESQEFVIASCYRNVSSTIRGFKVSLVRSTTSDIPTIQVSWGNQTTIIDYANINSDSGANRYFTSYRDVVVLSHNSERPNVLRVSCVLPTTSNNVAPYGANYGTYVSNIELTYANNIVDVPLILGGNYAGSGTTIEESSTTRKPAPGVIYWAKFWDADLGESNCSKLASWPHETVPFYLTGYNGVGDNNKTEQIYANSELSFVAAQGMGDRYYYVNRTVSTDEQDRYGWHLSEMRDICNNVIYLGMPEAYKSIISPAIISSAIRDINSNTGDYTYINSLEYSNDGIHSDDYLFLPAYREVDENATAGGTYGTEVRTQWTSPWAWMVPANLQILEYRQGTYRLIYKNASSNNFYRYRFLGNYIKSTAKIFNISDDPTSRTLQLDGTSTVLTVQSGDIWINNNVAYMYFTAEEILNGITVDSLVSNANYNGGWKSCNMWNLRTYSSQTTTASENVFLRVKTDGSIDTAPFNSQNTGDGRLMCPEFIV